MLQLIQTLYVCICGSGFTFKILWSAPFLALCIEYSQSKQSGQFIRPMLIRIFYKFFLHE